MKCVRDFTSWSAGVETVSSDMIKLRGDLRYVHDRMDKIEKAS